MRGRGHTGPKCTHTVHRYDGRRVSSLETQWDLEDVARMMSEAFVHNGNDMVLAYVKHVRAQPPQRQRQAIYLLLTKDDTIDSVNPAWFVLPENNNPDRLPIKWEPLLDMEAQLIVSICVSGTVDGKPKTVHFQAHHMIDALMSAEPEKNK